MANASVARLDLALRGARLDARSTDELASLVPRLVSDRIGDCHCRVGVPAYAELEFRRKLDCVQVLWRDVLELLLR